MKATLPCAVLLISALLAGCAEPLDPYGFTLPAHDSWVWPENTTLASSDWKDAGADSPEHALETFLWASQTGHTDRLKEVTYRRMGYKQEYVEKPDAAGEKPPEAAAHIGLDETYEFHTASEVEKVTAGMTDQERLQIYEYWLRPYIRGPLAMRHIGTPESPIPEEHFLPSANSTPPSGATIEKVDFIGDFDPTIYKFKPMLDVTILASKVLSHTEVELDVREHFPAESGRPPSYFYVPCDFQLLDGMSWKLITEQGFHVHAATANSQGTYPADEDEISYSPLRTPEEIKKMPPGRAVQIP